MIRHFAPVLAALLLSACSQDDSSPANLSSSKSLMPQGSHLKSLYIQSCYGCHSSGAGKAPRTGNQAEWSPRWQQGMDVLLEHTLKGYNNMPPKGMCMNCSDEDLRGLIRFMAGREGES